MKKIVLIIGILLSSFLTYSQENCEIFHSGTFEYGGKDVVTVKIKGDKHSEHHKNGVIKSTIVWVSDCEYNMTMTKITIPNFPYGPGDVMNVKVIRIEGNVIYYKSTVKGASWKGTMKKVK